MGAFCKRADRGPANLIVTVLRIFSRRFSPFQFAALIPTFLLSSHVAAIILTLLLSIHVAAITFTLLLSLSRCSSQFHGDSLQDHVFGALISRCRHHFHRAPLIFTAFLSTSRFCCYHFHGAACIFTVCTSCTTSTNIPTSPSFRD